MCGQRWANLYAVNPWNGNDSVIMSCPAMLVDFAAEVSEPINWIMQGYLQLKQCLMILPAVSIRSMYH